MSVFDERVIRNAKISHTMLGREDHGILTLYLTLEWDGGGQGFGGYCMDMYDKETKTRKPSKFGLALIMRILEVVGVSSWEKLKGQYVRMDGTYSKVHRIGNLLKEDWLDIDELAEQYKDAA